MKTIVGLFDDMEQAKRAALDIEAAGVPHNDISLVANNEGGRYAANDTGSGTGGQYADTGTGAGARPAVTGHAIGHDAKVGAEIGGVAGLLIGLTGLAIPGLGWIAGAGWLMGLIGGAATGAVVGGLVGALTHVGVPHEDAAHYTEGVRRGGTLVAVKADDMLAERVADILNADGAVDIDERGAQYRNEGFVAPAPGNYDTANAGTDAANTGTGRYADTGAGRSVELHAEELSARKESVQAGEVTLRKEVITETRNIDVPVTREEAVIERHAVNRPAAAADFRDETVSVPLTAERVTVQKTPVVTEEVSLGKRQVTETERISDTVRREEARIDNPQNVPLADRAGTVSDTNEMLDDEDVETTTTTDRRGTL